MEVSIDRSLRVRMSVPNRNPRLSGDWFSFSSIGEPQQLTKRRCVSRSQEALQRFAPLQQRIVHWPVTSSVRRVAADRVFSATRLCWSKGIGGCDDFMKVAREALASFRE